MAYEACIKPNQNLKFLFILWSSTSDSSIATFFVSLCPLNRLFCLQSTAFCRSSFSGVSRYSFKFYITFWSKSSSFVGRYVGIGAVSATNIKNLIFGVFFRLRARDSSLQYDLNVFIFSVDSH